MKFKVGDRIVRKSGQVGDRLQIGDIGLIKNVCVEANTYKVINQRNKEEQSWSESYIEKVKENQTIIIYPKGSEVIATIKEGKKVVKSAKATCNPSDTFDFEVGAKLAFGRLMGEEVKSNGSFKAKCVRTIDTGLTVGKVYEFIGGYGKWNNGDKMQERCNTIHELNKWLRSTSRFEEVIEPEAKPFRKAKVGDKIKIVKGGIDHCRKIGIDEILNVSYVSEKYVETVDFIFYDKNQEYIIIEEAKPVRRVNRKAEIGEWVEIIKAHNTHGNYKNGDILQIIPTEFTRPHYKDNYGCYLEESEYIVLENYKEKSCQTKFC